LVQKARRTLRTAERACSDSWSTWAVTPSLAWTRTSRSSTPSPTRSVSTTTKSHERLWSYPNFTITPRLPRQRTACPLVLQRPFTWYIKKKKNVLFPIFTNRFITRSVTSSPHSLPTSTSLSRAPKPRGSVLKEKPMTIPNSALPLSIAVVFCY